MDELRLIEGFDGELVRKLKPYLTVYPFAPGGCGSATRGCGINLNTAPIHVLSLLYYDDGVDSRLVDEEDVRRIVEGRKKKEGGICGPVASQTECTPMSQVMPNPIFPPPTVSTQIFLVRSKAQVGEIIRSVEAVVDRSETARPRLLSWQVR